MPPRDPDLRTRVSAGLADDAAQALRERIAAEVPRRLAENALRLLLHHQLSGSVAGVGYATATEMAAELGEGARRLYADELWYPGSALVRQLIECDYLLSLASEQPAEAEEWMRSSRDEIVRRFMPRHMRSRSAREFRVSEYQTHCDWGGHPNPVGRGLLRGHEAGRPVSDRWLWLDLALHLSEVWASFCGGARHFDPRQDQEDPLFSPEHSPDGRDGIDKLLAAWRHRDPLACRVPLPEA